MKISTDIEQSKKLIKILPIETADMYYPHFGGGQYGETPRVGKGCEMYSSKPDIPAWSLSALLEVYPMVVGRDMDMYCCWCNRHNLYSRHCNEPIDAVFEMVLKLKEKELI